MDPRIWLGGGLLALLAVAVEIGGWAGMSPLDVFLPVLWSTAVIGAWLLITRIWGAGKFTFGAMLAGLWLIWTGVLAPHASEITGEIPLYGQDWIRAVVFVLLAVLPIGLHLYRENR